MLTHGEAECSCSVNWGMRCRQQPQQPTSAGDVLVVKLGNCTPGETNDVSRLSVSTLSRIEQNLTHGARLKYWLEEGERGGGRLTQLD